MERSEETPKEKQRRKRRNKQQVYMDIMNAVTRLVKKEGFCQLNISKVAKEAQIDVNAILRNFRSFEGVLEAFLYSLGCHYNYQQKEYMETGCQSINDYNAFLLQTFDRLKLDHAAQQALRWEISELGLSNNPFMQNRDYRDKQIIAYWKDLFSGSELQIDVITALFVGGIRYIVLNRKHAPIYGVDFAKREGIAQLKETLNRLADILIKQKEETELKQRIAAKMKGKGLSQELIDECLE